MSIIKTTTPRELIERGAPKLFTTKAKDWTAKLVAWFETDEDGPKRALFPAQVEMVFIHLISHALSLLGKEAQHASEMRWLLFAKGHALDVAAANNSTFRLKANKAVCNLKFSLSASRNTDTFVKKGTSVGVGGNSDVSFVTLSDLTIPAGSLHGEVAAQAKEAGISGNGYTAGEINSPLDQIHSDLTVTNTDTTSGGADEEKDDPFRFRAMAAHDRISKAGPIASYKQQVRAFSSSIIDVEVSRPEAGHIWIYPLLNTGIPNATVLNDVGNWMSPLDKRPQGDVVTVKAPEAVTFTVSGPVRYSGDPVAIKAAATEAITNAARVYSSSLGEYLAIKTLNCGAARIDGVIDLDLTIAGPANRKLEPHQFGVLTGVNLTMEAANG